MLEQCHVEVNRCWLLLRCRTPYAFGFCTICLQRDTFRGNFLEPLIRPMMSTSMGQDRVSTKTSVNHIRGEPEERPGKADVRATEEQVRSLKSIFMDRIAVA